jgi:SM-20-related protein
MSYFTDEQWLEWIDRLAEDDYVIIDNFLPAELYASVRNFFLSHLQMEDFSKAGIGSSANHMIASSIRGDYVYWLDQTRDQTIGPFFTLTTEMIAMLNRYCYLSLSGGEFHLAHYPAGTYYHRHLDQFRERNNRMISVIIYLNEHWSDEDAGQLKLYLENNKEQLVEPVSNRCVMFRSNVLEHEVLLTHASRYSLTGWLLYQPPVVASLLQD